MNTNQSLTLIRGIPGSGKSTFAKQLQDLLPPLCFIVEADQFLTDSNGTYKYDPSLVKEAHKWCQERTNGILKLKHSVIVSNTFIRKWEMQPYLDMASKLNIPVTTIIMNNEFKSIHDVPQSVINRMKAQFEF